MITLFTLCLPTNHIRFGFLKVILLFVPNEDFLKILHNSPLTKLKHCSYTFIHKIK